LRNFKPLLAGLAGALLLAGCSLTEDYFGEKEPPPLPGKREAILETGRGLVADPALARLPVILPPQVRADWPVSGGHPANAGGHLAWGGAAAPAWRIDAGAGAQDEAQRPLSTPVVSNGRVYVLDAELTVRAFDAASGASLWSVDTAPEGEDDGFGGGLATDGARLYVAGGHAQALALTAADGQEVWRYRLPGPARAAPALANRLLVAATVDDAVVGLDAASGEKIWSVPASSEGASLLGGAPPTVYGNAVIAAFTYGDLVVFRLQDGQEMWRASLGSIRRYDFGAKFSDFGAPPAVAGDILYASSAAGRTAALAMQTGGTLWENRLGGPSGVWVAGEFLFLITDTSDLVCLYRRDGRIRWVQPLPRFEDPEDQSGPLTYTGPVLAGGRLLLTRSSGGLLQYDPTTGAKLAELPTGGDIYLPPIVANGTVYTLTNGGTLSAFR